MKKASYGPTGLGKAAGDIRPLRVPVGLEDSCRLCESYSKEAHLPFLNVVFSNLFDHETSFNKRYTYN